MDISFEKYQARGSPFDEYNYELCIDVKRRVNSEQNSIAYAIPTFRDSVRDTNEKNTIDFY